MGIESIRKEPHDIEAEKTLLSQVFIDNKILYTIIDVQLERLDFYIEEYGLVYDTMLSLIHNNKVADIITIKDLIDVDVSDIVFAAMSTNGAKEYATIIKDHSTRRKIIKQANRVMVQSFDKEDIKHLQVESDKLLKTCYMTEDEKIFMDELDGYHGELYEIQSDNVPTNYKIIDNKLGGGFSRGQLVTIAGRPGTGKSAVMTNLCLSMENVVMFSIEMSKKEIAYRMYSAVSGVPFQKFKQGLAGENAIVQQDVQLALAKIKKKNISVYDKKLDINSIKLEVKKLKITNNIDVVFIDYLQILKQEDKKLNRATFIGQITRDLKLLAKELQIVVIMGAQLNREVEKRRMGGPKLSDLRESGDIEQDSDIVVLLERDMDYGNEIEFIIAKHRNGPTGELTLAFDAKTMTLRNKIIEEKKSEDVLDDSDDLF